MKIVTGNTEEGQRVIGMQESLTSASQIFEDSVAVIPNNVRDADAISTYISALSTIHCALPKIQSIGGSTDAAMINRKAVVLGSNILACFAAEGLASLGLDVSLVSTGNPKVNTRIGKLQILKPAVGDDEVGFASYIGEFDSLVDTISNELKTNFMLNDDDDDDDDDIQDSPFGSSILGLLKSRHNCRRYISTETECQKIVAKEGIFGGPGKADDYAKNAANSGFDKEEDSRQIPPPKDIGNSITALLENGVLFTQAERKKLYSKSEIVRGWTLGDFWEKTRWPRDASGSLDVRFGLPVISFDEEEEAEQAELLARLDDAPSSSFEILAAKKRQLRDDTFEEAPQPIQNNPHVFHINGVSGLNLVIRDTKKDCILFLSARFCQTCKRLDPKYTRMARMEKDNDSSVLFAKAEMGSSWGKQLGRHLDADAVPAFVLFRKGKQFGSAISVSDLPSTKIEQALDLLESGGDWDPKTAIK